MTEAKPTGTARRGRIFPEIQWTEEQKAKRQAEREAFYERCKPIFDRVQPEFIKTHYNWYITIEPESGDYFIDKDEIIVMNICRKKHPNAPFYLFQINETGISGTI
jgi:hypothetical protein